MSELESASDVCSLCGRPTDADGEALWLDLEVFSEAGFNYVSFCRREHAAEWFGRPLPAPDEAFDSSPGSDRFFAITFSLVVIWFIGLAILGQITLVRWIWS